MFFPFKSLNSTYFTNPSGCFLYSSIPISCLPVVLFISLNNQNFLTYLTNHQEESLSVLFLNLLKLTFLVLILTPLSSLSYKNLIFSALFGTISVSGVAVSPSTLLSLSLDKLSLPFFTFFW